ncbi:dTDP-4-dehydrorhamnose 3,5-epimerase [candidate division KSB1 bacterium]|nr:dTDP-4-dehydrorhamnose 3,5-epimerase [candidate division KSB1 bacterium]
MPFEFQKTELIGVYYIEIKKFPDERGFFMESYKRSEFVSNGITEKFVQDNHSRSSRGVLRGLHYQKNPKAQGKLIRVLKGEIFDVAVDIRKGSPTYGKWTGEVLSEDKANMLYVPPGFAHGFCVLSYQADIFYKTTEEYAPECDSGIIWNDPELNIQWPITDPILSSKDAQLPLFQDADNNYAYI